MRLIDADLAKQKIVTLEHEPDYQHEGEDWSVGLCMAESVLDEVPNATEELINEIYLGVRRDCVDKDGAFMPGPFMNLMLDLKQKYGVK
jgi:hypothetical protein